MFHRRTLTQAGDIAAAAQQAVKRQEAGRRTPTKPPIEIDLVPLIDCASRGGMSDGTRADTDSHPIGGPADSTHQRGRDGHLGYLASQLTLITLERLGRHALADAAQANSTVAKALAQARVGRSPIGRPLLAALVVVFAITEVAAGLLAYNLLFASQNAFTTGLIAVTVAVVIAYTGFLLADALVRLINPRAVLGLAAVASMLMLAALVVGSVGLRTSESTHQAAQDSLNTATQAAVYGGELDTSEEARALEQANEDRSRAALWLFIGLIGLPVAAGLLAKSLVIIDGRRREIALDARTQSDRTNDIATARRAVDRLHCYPVAAMEVLRARTAVWDAYLGGYRATAPADAADLLHRAHTDLGEIEPPEWITSLENAVATLNRQIESAEHHLALPLSPETPVDLLVPPDVVDVTRNHWETQTQPGIAKPS